MYVSMCDCDKNCCKQIWVAVVSRSKTLWSMNTFLKMSRIQKPSRKIGRSCARSAVLFIVDMRYEPARIVHSTPRVPLRAKQLQHVNSIFSISTSGERDIWDYTSFLGSCRVWLYLANKSMWSLIFPHCIHWLARAWWVHALSLHGVPPSSHWSLEVPPLTS